MAPTGTLVAEPREVAASAAVCGMPGWLAHRDALALKPGRRPSITSSATSSSFLAMFIENIMGVNACVPSDPVSHFLMGRG